MDIFINRTLNLKKIKAIGFDMDYTLVRYNTEEFEKLAFNAALEKLVNLKNYPESIKKIKFDFEKVIQGLVIDKRRGNLLKLSRFGKVKTAYHGTKALNFHELQKVYENKVIDLSHDNIQSLDTNFSVSNGIAYSELVTKKDEGLDLPDYLVLAEDIREMVDLAHRDGTLKGSVRKDISKYIVKDEKTVEMLERLKRNDKKLLVITNSDYAYTKLLLDYTINPYLKEHKHWRELFDLTITLSMKPRFFTEKNLFLEIDQDNGLMNNCEGALKPNGCYQGGNAKQLEKELSLKGDEILYLGDHIYGDVVSIKKTCNWRTALVLDPLKEEVHGLKQGQKLQKQIDRLMKEKSGLEDKINELYAKEHEKNEAVEKEEINNLFNKLDKLNEDISKNIVEFQKGFNPYWGELMRAGHEESRFAGQVEKYACIYMSKISDLYGLSPRTYFRPPRRLLPHERIS